MQQPSTILVVEDDYLNRRLIKSILEKHHYLVHDTGTYEQALAILEAQPPALALLDINLGHNLQKGIALGHYIQTHFHFPFIYLTAYDTAAIISNALLTAPSSYLTKPFKDVDLTTAIAVALRNKEDKSKLLPVLTVKDGSFLVDIPFSDVDLIEADGNYLIIFCGQKDYKIRCTIKSMVASIPVPFLVQTHRAFIVNIHKVDKLNPQAVVVRGRHALVSKQYYQEVFEKWSNR